MKSSLKAVLASVGVASLFLVACEKTDAVATPEAKPEAAKPVEAPKPPANESPTVVNAGTPPPGAPDPKIEADTIFSQRCSVCHGMSGKGDGPGAAALNPKPRDYNDAAWQKSVTDEYISKVIIEGGASVGKSPTMVANADLKTKPEVVKALVAKVRSFAVAAAPAPAPAPAPKK